MTNDEYKFGESPHYWNHWMGLAQRTASRCKEFSKDFKDRELFGFEREALKRYDIPNGLTITKVSEMNRFSAEDWIRRTYSGEGMTGSPQKEIIKRHFQDELGIDLQTISREEFENLLKERVSFGLRFDVVKRLDNLAVRVNDSTHKAVFESGPFEWKLYLESCREAAHSLYGPTSESYLDKIVIPEGAL